MPQNDEEKMMLNFGDWVKQYLSVTPYGTVKDLSEHLGVSTSLIYKYINNESSPTLENAYEIAKYLGFSLDNLSYISSIDNHKPGIPKLFDKAESREWMLYAAEKRLDLNELRTLVEEICGLLKKYFYMTNGHDFHSLLPILLETYMRGSASAFNIQYRVESNFLFSPELVSLAQSQINAIKAISDYWQSTILEALKEKYPDFDLEAERALWRQIVERGSD